MSHPLLRHWQVRVRRRRAAIVLGWTLPLLLSLLIVLVRIGPLPVAIAGALLGIGFVLVLIVRAVRPVDPQWVARRFELAVPSLEDSTDLLLTHRDDVSPLQVLQRERILGRLDTLSIPDLRPAWPWRRIALCCLIGAIPALAAVFWPQSGARTSAEVALAAPPAPSPTTTRILAGELDISAPAYTGLAARHESQLETAAAEGSRLRWKLQFDPAPKAAVLEFLDGTKLPLEHAGDQWSAERRLDQSMLYRIVLDSSLPLSEDRLYRLDAIVDRPPEIRVIEPDRTLSEVSAGQRSWSLDFEVNDDYGLGEAQLRMTLAQGSGEQVTVSERGLALAAEQGGDARHRRFRHRFAIDRLGIAAGDDLIVRLEIEDNRQPKPNVARSAGYILRWPPEMSAQSEGVDGIVQKVLPAYFRSQRQIIIDTESLIAERAKTEPDRFLAKSDSIGVDQKILRLRYGQFLGEEFESGAGRGQHEGEQKGTDESSPTQQDALSANDPHADETTRTSAPFGSASDVLAEYGHTHDHAEAATLLDPQTKKTLKAALAEMWQAELHLRQGEPVKALPYENRALVLIKQVQQSTRIYLARVGLELPVADESRRLSGERAGLRDPRGDLVPATVEEQPLIELYRTLQANEPVPFDAFEDWLREHSERVPDALGLIAATDALRRQPDCADCRQRLLDRLWTLLPTPAATTRLRPAADPIGRSYLGNLGTGTQP